MSHNVFIPDWPGPKKGKAEGALEASREGYNHIIAYFGAIENIPTSVMRADKQKPTQENDGPGTERSYKETAPVKLETMKEKGIRTIGALGGFAVSGKGCGSGALSIFPQNICKSIVLLYSNPGDVVFDPFIGHNSRMECCVENGRHYIGNDLSTEFMKFNWRKAKRLQKKYPEARIQLHHGDSRKIPVKNEVGDFTITSPPYWDIEYYGDEPEQMSSCKTYEDFLQSMQLVMDENFRILKSGAYAAWFINDFRKNGIFYSYHSDIINLGRNSGFLHHDILIVDFGRGFRDCFPNQTLQQRIIPKRHEYGVIFKKP